MIIPLMYLNKHAATINAIKDYNAMKHILLSYSDNTTELREHLTSVHAPTLSWSAPGTINPRAEEGKIALSLDLMDVVRDRYQKALEYMAWFQPAWDALSGDERFILTEFFMKNDIRKTELISNISERLCLERAQIYRRRESAIAHLSLLLYGK